MEGSSMSQTNETRRTLMRDKAKGKIAGVCAGIADYYNIEVWLVRIIAVTALIFSSSFVTVIYIALWFILDEKPAEHAALQTSHIGVKLKVWEVGEEQRGAFLEFQQEFKALDKALQKWKGKLTSNSSKFNVNL